RERIFPEQELERRAIEFERGWFALCPSFLAVDDWMRKSLIAGHPSREMGPWPSSVAMVADRNRDRPPGLPPDHSDLDLAVAAETCFQVALLHLMAPYFLSISVV